MDPPENCRPCAFHGVSPLILMVLRAILRISTGTQRTPMDRLHWESIWYAAFRHTLPQKLIA
jgi:hypothetical protein